MGAALVLKGNRIEGEVFAFDALRCDTSHALARYSGRQFCDKGHLSRPRRANSASCNWNRKSTSR